MAGSIPLAAMVEARLAEFLGRGDEALRDERALAVEFKALPLYSDGHGCYLLRPSGELLFVHGAPGAASPHLSSDAIDPTWRLIALSSGAHRYPEFKVLLPARARGDSDCKECGGAGLTFSAQAPHGQLCSGCFGLGWRPGG